MNRATERQRHTGNLLKVNETVNIQGKCACSELLCSSSHDDYKYPAVHRGMALEALSLSVSPLTFLGGQFCCLPQITLVVHPCIQKWLRVVFSDPETPVDWPGYSNSRDHLENHKVLQLGAPEIEAPFAVRDHYRCLPFVARISTNHFASWYFERRSSELKFLM